MDQDDWKRRWKEIGPERRRKILRAIQRGEAVADVRDASVTVELIDRRMRHAARFERSRKWLAPKHVLLFAAFGFPIGLVTHNLLIAGIYVVLALYMLPLGTFLRRLETRAKLAREKNEQLVRQL